MTGIKNAVIQPFINAWTTLQLGVKGVQLAWEQSIFGSGDTETIKKLKGEDEANKNLLMAQLSN